MALVKNFLYLAGAESVSKLLTFAAMAYLARVAGPAGFGYVEFALAVLLVAGLVVDQGFGPYGAREIAKHPVHTVQLVSQIVAIRSVLAIAACVLVVAAAFGLQRSPVVAQLLLIYSASLFLMPFLLQWVFQGHDQMRKVAAMQVLRQGVFAVVIFAFVRGPAQLWLVAVAEVAGAAAAVFLGVWVYVRQFEGALRSRLMLSKRPFVEGLPIGLSQIFWTVRMYGATLILGLMASPQEVGYFASAMRILVALHAFVWLYYFNLLPSMARAWRRADGSFASLIATSLYSLAWLVAVSLVLWVGLAPQAITGVYGAAFRPAALTLQWLAGVCMLALISGNYRFGLIAAGHQTLEMITSAIGALFAILLIPAGYHWIGLAGSAIGLLFAEAAVWVCAWIFARRVLDLRGHLRILVWPAAATILAGGVLLFLPVASLVLRTVAAVILLVAIAFSTDSTLRRQFPRSFEEMVHLAQIVLRVQPQQISPPRSGANAGDASSNPK